MWRLLVDTILITVYYTKLFVTSAKIISIAVCNWIAYNNLLDATIPYTAQRLKNNRT